MTAKSILLAGLLWRTALVIIVASCNAHAVAANMVYDLISFPTLQNGYSVSGTITTDGTLGSISDSHILDSSISSVTDGMNTYQNVHPNDTFSTVNLMATATGIFLAASPTGTPFPQFTIASTGYDTVQIQYDYIQTAPGTTILLYDGSVNHPFTLTQLWLVSDTNVLGLTGEPWMIARAVPEPSSIALLVIGAIGLAAMARRRCAIVQNSAF